MTVDAQQQCLDVTSAALALTVTPGQTYTLTASGEYDHGAGEKRRGAHVLWVAAGGAARASAVTAEKPLEITPSTDTVRLVQVVSGKCSDDSGDIMVSGLGEPIAVGHENCIKVSDSHPGLPLQASSTYVVKISGDAQSGDAPLLDLLANHSGAWTCSVDQSRVGVGESVGFETSSTLCSGFYAFFVEAGTCGDNTGSYTVTLERY